MFDIAWSELALIGAVALVVIGPKDLPKVMRTMGQWTRRARLLAGEFQHSVDEMIRQAELEELRKKVQDVNPAATKFSQAMDEAVQGTPEPATEAEKAETVASDVAAPAEPVPEEPSPEDRPAAVEVPSADGAADVAVSEAKDPAPKREPAP